MEHITGTMWWLLTFSFLLGAMTVSVIINVSETIRLTRKYKKDLD